MSGKTPHFKAYTIVEREEKQAWIELGVAFKHRDGDGFTIRIHASPLDGTIVLRPFSAGRRTPSPRNTIIVPKIDDKPADFILDPADLT